MRLYKAWYEDDLPNILGINPIEASLVAGALYYFYGPTVLYEYARNAGKLFSTYAPVVKSISTDIFNEFRDYFEEEREREGLKKQGVDVDSLPRRTSNIIERISDTFKSLDESTSSKGMASMSVLGQDEVDDYYDDDDYSDEEDDAVKQSAASAIQQDERVAVSAVSAVSGGVVGSVLPMSMSGTPRRPTKREVMTAKGERGRGASRGDSDIDNTEAADNAMELKQSIETVKDRIAALKGRAVDSPLDAAQSNQRREDDMGSSPYTAAAGPVLAQLGAGNLEAAAGMSRFQQQLSGQWNQRVIRTESYQSPAPADASTGTSYIGGEYSADNNSGVADNYGEESWSSFASGRDVDMNLSFEPQTRTDGIIIPEDLAFDSPAAVFSEGAGGAIEQTLAEIDRDYSALRGKLVTLLLRQQEQLALLAPNVVTPIKPHYTMEEPGVSGLPADSTGDSLDVLPSRRTYWPPRSVPRKVS